MSNITYTAEQVERMLAEQKAKLTAKPKEGKLVIQRQTRARKDGTPYTGVWLLGLTKPVYLSDTLAKAVAANMEAFIAAITAEPVVKIEQEEAESAFSESTEPRISAKS